MTEHPSIDVVVMARGGGSVQDLACFDDEGLCRAVFACELPVVCAIGHTDNDPVCNHVAWPAYTPSRSAELVVPCAAELRRDIALARSRLDDVPGQLALVSERVQRTVERLSCAAALDDRARLASECAGRVQGALEDFLTNHEHGLQQAGGALSATPHRAARKLAAEQEGLPAMAATLFRAGERVDRLAVDVRALGERVRTATRRQTDDHIRDYGRALDRLLREARAGVGRRAARASELVSRQAVRLSEGSRRRLGDARRDTEHVGALVAAHDFRSRGWLLAATHDGMPVCSTADLCPGQRIDLRLHDGQANAVIETIDPTREAIRHERNQ